MAHRRFSAWSAKLALLIGGVTLIALCSAAGASDESEHSPLAAPIVEDFEGAPAGSLPSGWQVYGSGTDTPYVIEAPAGVGAISGSKVLRVGRTAGTSTNTNRAYLEFGPVDDRLVISYWFYTESTRRTLNVSITGSGRTGFLNRDAAIFLTIFHQGRIIRAYRPDGSWENGPAVSPERWHKVTLDIDVKANTFDLYLDDSDRPSIEKAKFINPSRDIAAIAFNYQSAVSDDNTVPVYVDDLVVRRGSIQRGASEAGTTVPEDRAVTLALSDEMTHPFLIVRTSDYEALRERSNRAPWNSMKEDALQTVRAGAPFGEAISAASLLYILDPDNRDQYVDLLRRWLLEWNANYNRVRGTRASRHAEMVAPSHDFLHSILALDIIYNDLDPEDRLAIIRGMDNMAAWFAQQGESWPLNKYAVIGTWALFRGDRKTFLDAKAKYDHWLFDRYLTPGGVFVPGPGYAFFRLAKENFTKSFFMDILEFTGEGKYYDDPRLVSFYEWVFAGALTPTRNLASFGDTSPNGTSNKAVVTAVKARRFSELAANHAAWAVFGAMPSNAAMSRQERLTLLSIDPSGFNTSPPRGRLLDYVLIDDYLAEPKKPTSRIWDAYAAFWEANPSDQSLMGALWNVTKSDGHSHKDTNAVHIHGYGHPLLRNAGYPGWNQGWGEFSWPYFNDTAVSNNVVLIAGQDHQHKYGNGIVEGFTGPALDYASGDSGRAMANGRHIRNFVFVHPQGGKAGYFVLFDEVTVDRRGDPVNLVLHPHSDSYEAVRAGEEYRWKIKNADDVYLTIHLSAAPASADIRSGALEMSSATFVGKYLYATYDSTGDRVARISTVLFPHKGKENKPVMSRISREGYDGTEIRWSASSSDTILSSKSAVRNP